MASPVEDQTWRDRSECAAKYHGNMTAYTRYRCRCPDARADKRLYIKQGLAGIRAPRLVDGTGTRRRLRALAALGWTYRDIAAHMDLSACSVEQIGRGQYPRVRVVTADAVKRVYAELCMTPGRSAGTRRYAAQHGWAPPLAWDDDTIDDPTAEPDIGVRRARDRGDVAAEARHLLAGGCSMREVAQRLDVSESYVRQLLGGGKKAAA